jgi:thiamine-monophosphate kinase
MRLRTLGERGLIRAIRKEFSESRKDIILGIGDDAAVVKPCRKPLILTKDLLFEGVDFISSLHPPFFLGRKSLNVNLSDIAAMGGIPKYALLGLGLPSNFDILWIKEFLSGFHSAARGGGVLLIGGDLSSANKISISVTVIGEGKNIIRRSGGKPSHILFVSGFLGDSKQGFLLLKRGLKLGDDKRADPLLKAFLDPVPQISLGNELARRGLASAMIDVSDGLSVDLLHICEESGCGAKIELGRLPLSPSLRYFQKRPFPFALHGGEDFQLLFSVADRNLQSILRLQKKFRMTEIGRLTRRKGIFLIDRKGRKRQLPIKGYEHWGRSPR